MLETGDLDFSTVGVKPALVTITLRCGVTYWLGIQNSYTATLSAWASTATPDLNGGAPVTTARKVRRLTLAYATAAPVTWGYFASETNAEPGTAIYVQASDIEPVVGALLTIGSVVWSIADKRGRLAYPPQF